MAGTFQSDTGGTFIPLLSNDMNDKNQSAVSSEQNDVIIYHSKDGKIAVALMTRDGNVWLSQLQIATLFGTSVQNIGQHIANILKERELDANSVIKNYFITARRKHPFLPKYRVIQDRLFSSDVDRFSIEGRILPELLLDGE